ncbi:hypothetical protein L9F63_014728, partial [Diploptera punctata]
DICWFRHKYFSFTSLSYLVRFGTWIPGALRWTEFKGSSGIFFSDEATFHLSGKSIKMVLLPTGPMKF